MSAPRRPAFAADFPQNPELDALVDAFSRGDYGRVRHDAPALARTAADPPVRLAATVLFQRTRPDPLALGLLGVTAALLVAMSVYWVAFGGAPPSHPTVEHVNVK